jgi:DNA-binding response OmpR family regulator
MRLLVVEDDADLRTALIGSFKQPDFEIDSISDGRQALEVLSVREYDVAIIDLGLPGMDGLTIVRTLRRRSVGLPIIIVTARDSLEDRLAGLNSGADDYLIKPFELAELEARVNALLRRHRADRNMSVTIGTLVFTPGQPRVLLDGVAVDLPPGEATLLEILVLRTGKVVRKEEIADRLARDGDPPSDTAIEICVHRLRRRLGSYGLKVRTLRGFGYLLEPHCQ